MAITATFQANFDQFVAAVKGATASLDGIKTTAQTVGTAVAASLATAELRRFSGDVQRAATDFIQAYAEEEAAISRLTTALKAQGSFTPELARQYADLATAFQKTTRFSDDAITGIQALLVQVGGVLPGQMGTALRAVTNLAAGMGPQVGGLEGAALLVAKAFSSDGESLGRLKVILGDAIGPTASMEEVMAALNQKFGGQAAADIETTAGKMAQFGNTANEVQETVGRLLITVLTPLADFFASMPTWVQTGVVALGVVGAAVAPLALSFTALVTVLTPLVPLLGTALTGAFTALLPFLGPAGLIAAGLTGLYLIFRNFDAIKAAFISALDGIRSAFATFVGQIQSYVSSILGMWASLKSAVGGVIGAAAPSTGGMAIPSFAQGSGGFQNFGSGTLAMLHGREAVISASGGGGGIGAPITINLYGTPEWLAQQVKDVLTRDILQGRRVAA